MSLSEVRRAAYATNSSGSSNHRLVTRCRPSTDLCNVGAQATSEVSRNAVKEFAEKLPLLEKPVEDLRLGSTEYICLRFLCNFITCYD